MLHFVIENCSKGLIKFDLLIVHSWSKISTNKPKRAKVIYNICYRKCKANWKNEVMWISKILLLLTHRCLQKMNAFDKYLFDVWYFEIALKLNSHLVFPFNIIDNDNFFSFMCFVINAIYGVVDGQSSQSSKNTFFLE